MPRVSVSVVALLLLWSGAVLAAPDGEPAVEDRNAEAVALGRGGLDAYQLGDWPKAYEVFESAERTAHSPVFVLYMARCKRNQGALLAARELYARVPETSPSTPEPWQRAAEDARRELAELLVRVPSIVIQLTRAGHGQIEIAVDGKPAAPLVEIELDPGPHRITARRSGGALAERSIVLAESQKRLPQLLEFPPEQSPEPVPAPPSDRTPSAPNVPAYVAAGVGLLGIAFGTVTGVIALSKRNDVKKGCDPDGTHCDAEDEPKMESARTYANLSTAGFVVGAAGVATGAVLFWVAIPSSGGSQAGGAFESVALGMKTVF